VRGAFVAALFSAFGALLFIRLVAPQGLSLLGTRDADAIEGRYLRLVRTSLIAALVALLGWLPLEASDMSDAGEKNSEAVTNGAFCQALLVMHSHLR
jgi:hypothetical protein